MNHIPPAALAVIVLLLGSCASVDPGAARAEELKAAQQALVVEPPTQRKVDKPLFLAHYMPWYQARPFSKSFGWHWHMGFYDPYEVLADGTRAIATHYYPLTGPYDSADPKVIEYQLLTMKASGIDGVIIDWYGIDAALDYVSIHKASQVLFEAVRKAGMTFAVCYEDQSITKMIQAKTFTADQAVPRAAATFRWMNQNWFQDPAYLKLDGKPVVLNFGPQKFTRWSDWRTIFDSSGVKPWFVSLEDHSEHDADGFYNWPEMSKSVSGVLSLDTLVGQLNTFYAKTRDSQRLIASAWPGFHDIYEQAGVASTYGFLDDYDGGTFRLTLGAALAAKPDVIQLATWNDYGEGTVLEPNRVRGYGPLEDLQRARKTVDPAFGFTAEDLRLPFDLWKKRSDKAADQSALDRIAAAITEGRPDEARRRAAEAGIGPIQGETRP